MNPINQQFSVAFDYPVWFGRGLFDVENPVLKEALIRKRSDRKPRVLVLLDANLHAATPGLADRISTYFNTHAEVLELVKPPQDIPGGEDIKNDYRKVMEIIDTILEYRLCRQSIVVAVGGGAVLDAVGFAVALVHRGLRLVRLPTTVLGQNDAGLGVKNGMNLHGGKNTIGTFAPPFAVLNDFDFLETLPDPEWRSGISEAFKVAIIQDADFLFFLCEQATAIRNRNRAAMEELILRCGKLHLDHIRTSGDPFEQGSARPLDFGHWAAHKLESMSHYTIPHGHAVGVGIALDSHYALRQGWLKPEAYDAIVRGLRDAGLILWYHEMERRLGDGTYEILGGLEDFREHLGGELCVTFPLGIGRKQEVSEVDEALMAEGLEALKSRFGTPSLST